MNAIKIDTAREHLNQKVAFKALEAGGIEVKPENANYIEAALRTLNGTVVDRKFMKFDELQDMVNSAEGVSEKSGERTMAFAVKRKTSTVASETCAASLQVERRDDGWYLVNIAHATVEKPSDEVPVLRIGRGGARLGAGRPAMPGLSQYKLTLDDKAYAVFQEYGEGNASLGARMLAQHAYEGALVVGLREDVDDALQGLAEAAGVSTGEVVEQLVLEAWANVSAGAR